MQLYYDTEADNLLPKVTCLHCIGAIDIDTDTEFYFGPPVPVEHPLATPVLVTPTGTLEQGLEFLAQAELVVAHNGLDYDRRMLTKLYPGRPLPPKEWDSLVTAKLLWPYDMLMGPDYANMLKGKFPGNLLKSHSLKAWGLRLGTLKDEYKGGFATWNPDMASYMMQDCRAGLTLWRKCLVRLGWKDAEPLTYVWPALPVEIEHGIQSIILEQTEDGVNFNRDEAIELSRTLNNAAAAVAQELKDTFGSWWRPLDNPDTGAPLGSTMKRQMAELPSVTVLRYGKKGQPLKPYFGPPLEDREAGDAYCRVEWTEFSPGSRDHLANRLSALYGWVPKEFGKDGKPKLDETVIKEIPDFVVPADIKAKCLAYFKITKTLGMLSTGNKSWLAMIDGVKKGDGDWRYAPSPDGRMHGTMDTNGAITSRAIHKDPNLSQVPAVSVDKAGHPIMGLEGGYGYECRALFQADDGWEQTGIDVTALELITLGHYLHPLDGGAFSERVCDPNRDPHTEHSELTGVPRQETKTCTYLYIYGGSAWKLTFEISIEDAEIPKFLGYKGMGNLLRSLRKRFGDEFVDRMGDKDRALLAKARTIIIAFEAGIKGIKDLKEHIAVTARRGWLRGLDGRKLFIKKAHAGLSALNQGAGSIICKLWIINTHKALRAAGLERGRDFKQILWSHDEIQVTHRPGLGPQITAIALRTLEETGRTLGLRGALRGAGKTGRNWAECH